LQGGCVLLDLKMPKMGGFELQQRLTESGIHIPVIVMTGQGGVPEAVRAIKAGATDFIEKPIDDERLLNAIRGPVCHSSRRACGRGGLN
jgi:two-component system response regulator FixJ